MAQDVVPEQVSLPEVAGRLRTAEMMCPERAKVFKDLSVIKLESDALPACSTKACHKIDKDTEVDFIRSLLRREMVVLIEESEIERHPVSGQLLKGGFFAVPHKPGRLRLIYDRRPQNELESDLSESWLHLPHRFAILRNDSASQCWSAWICCRLTLLVLPAETRGSLVAQAGRRPPTRGN